MNRAEFAAAIQRLTKDIEGDLFEVMIGHGAAALEKVRAQIRAAIPAGRPRPTPKVRACRVCGCTDDDCSGCVSRTGKPCRWIGKDLCSACGVAANAMAANRPPEPTPCRVCGELGHDARRHIRDRAEASPKPPAPAAAPEPAAEVDAPEPSGFDPAEADDETPHDDDQEDDEDDADPDDDEEDTEGPPAPPAAVRSAPVRPAGGDRFAALETARRARLAREASR